MQIPPLDTALLLAIFGVALGDALALPRGIEAVHRFGIPLPGRPRAFIDAEPPPWLLDPDHEDRGGPYEFVLDEHQVATWIGADRIGFYNYRDRENHHEGQAHERRLLSAFGVPVSGILRIERTDSGLALSSRRVLRGPYLLFTAGLVYLLATHLDVLTGLGGLMWPAVIVGLVGFVWTVWLSYARAGRVDEKLREDLAERIRGARRDGPLAGPAVDQ